MKIQSIQFKFLMTVISAMLAITIFIGGLSIYEVDQFVQWQTANFIDVTCEKEASQINDSFGDMEKSVHIMESYVIGLIESEAELTNREKQENIIQQAEYMFAEVANQTEGAIAYYFRFAPEISHNTCGLYYSKMKGKDGFIRLEPTDLSLYEKDDVEHVGWYWQPYEAKKPVWMSPYYNQNSEILMISYVTPMFYNHRFIGMAGMDFDYNVLTDKVDKIIVYEHGYAHLENDGFITYHKNLRAGSKAPDVSKEYMQVGKPIKNGMTLILSASYQDIRRIRYDIAFKILFVTLLLAVMFSLIVFLIVRKIVHPLRELTDASVKLSKGKYDVEIAHSDTYEIKLLSTAFENMAQHLKENEKLQHLLAYRDALTGLRNTNSYKAWVNDFEKETTPKTFGVVILDINDLKQTNDRYGHDAGNKLIVAAAQFISGIFQRSPVFRIGGDEFLVILQNRDLAEVRELLQKFEAECENEWIAVDGVNIPVNIAMGFAQYDSQKDTAFIDVFNRADDAMYENKREMKGWK